MSETTNATLFASAAHERRFRSAVRAAANARKHRPVVIIEEPADQPPVLRGHVAYYVNASGDVIDHPKAYRRAWGKPTYVASTLRVEIGRECAEHFAALTRAAR